MPKNYCNRTLIVKVIVENVVTCFLGTQCTCDAALCAPCTWAPLRFVRKGAVSGALPLPFAFRRSRLWNYLPRVLRHIATTLLASDILWRYFSLRVLGYSACTVHQGLWRLCAIQINVLLTYLGLLHQAGWDIKQVTSVNNYLCRRISLKNVACRHNDIRC